MGNRKKRNWIIAFLLTFLLPGLGQVYNGQLVKGIIGYAGTCVASMMVYGYAGLADTFSGLVGILALLGACCIGLAIEAAIQARRTNREGGVVPRRYNRWFVYFTAILVAGFVITPFEKELFPLQAFRIPAGSMRPTLEAGDCLMVDKGQRTPALNKLMVFRPPMDPPTLFIKRVVGLPGDVLEMRGKTLYRNGAEAVDIPAWHSDDKTNPKRDDFAPLTVPEGQYFMLGDNRDDSYDSRFFGTVPAEAMVGEALYVYFSPNGANVGKEL